MKKQPQPNPVPLGRGFGGITHKTHKMIRTTSLTHYKELKSKGITCELVTKADLNTPHKA